MAALLAKLVIIDHCITMKILTGIHVEWMLLWHVPPPWQWHYLTTPMSIEGPFKNIMIDCTLNPQRSGVHACFGSKGRTSSWWVYCNYMYCNSDIAPHLLTVDMYKFVHKSCIWMNISQTNWWHINIFIPEVVHTYRRN